MLTDDEKRAIRAKVKEASGEWHFDLMMYANEIERAVLAKAGEQEPVLIGYWEQDPSFSAIDYLPGIIRGSFPNGTPVYIGAVPEQAIPERWREDWKKNVMLLWTCARKHDSSIPDDQLDFMRDMLLSASPKP